MVLMMNASSWCDENMQRLYPLADDASTVSLSGVALPPSFLVDIQLVLPDMQDTDASRKFYVSAIDRTASGFVVELSYQADANTSIACARSSEIPDTLTNTDSLEDRTFVLTSTLDDNAEFSQLMDINGRLVVGTCVDMRNLGMMKFQWEATKIMPLRVYFFEGALDSITFQGASGSWTMTKNFTLRAGEGIDFSVDESGEEPVVIVSRKNTTEEELASSGFSSVSAVVREIWNQFGNPIRTINGIVPDTNGNIDLKGADCIEVNIRQNSVNLSNPCGKPCCNEETSQDIRERLEFLEEAQKRVLECYNAINANIINMQSRLVTMLNS